jgi:WD40 repeat protein
MRIGQLAAVTLLVAAGCGARAGTSTNDGANGGEAQVFSLCRTLTLADQMTRTIDSPAVKALAVSKDGRLLAVTPGADGTNDSVTLWRLDEMSPLSQVSAEMVYHLDFTPDGSTLGAAGDARATYAVATGAFLSDFGGPPSSVSALPYFSPNGIAFSHDGSRAAVGTWGPGTYVYGVADGQLISQFPGSVASPAAAFSADDTLLATSEVALRRLSDGSVLWSSPRPPIPDWVGFVDSHVEFSPDGSTLLVSSCTSVQFDSDLGCNTQLLRVSDGSLVQDLGRVLPQRPTFLPDGKRILAGSMVLDLATRVVTALPVDATVSIPLPDGRIASGGFDGVVRLLCPSH